MRAEKKRRGLNWCFAFLLLFLGSVLPIFLTEQIRATHQYVIGDTYGFEELSKVDIVQEFTPEYRYLYSIELLFILIGSETDGNIRIQIESPSGGMICDKVFAASDIAAGDFVSFKLNTRLKKGKTYRLHLIYDGTATEKPEVMTSEKDRNLYETGDMYVGGNLSEVNMAITYHYR